MHRWIAAALAALTLAAYGHVLFNGFIDLDDQLYAARNPHVLSGLTAENIVWAFTTFTGSLYQPLTWLSLQLDATLFGNSAWSFHLTNLLLHTLNVLLVYILLHAMTQAPWRSAIVAALFAVHPMHVESVAWVSERKDVLMAFFWLLMIGAYLRYTQRPSMARYALVVLTFVCGLLSKAMIVTAPFVLLLLDVWPLARLKATSRRPWGVLVLEKTPLFVLAIAAAAVTVYAVDLQHPDVLDLDKLPPWHRGVLTVAAYAWYLRTTFVPVDLAIVYRHPEVTLQLLAGSAAVLIVFAAMMFIGRRRLAVTVGCLWFVGTLFPIAAVANAGSVPWADRYVYVPHIGLFIAVVWGTQAVLQRLHARAGLGGAVAVVAVLALATATWFQVLLWRDSGSLFIHALNLEENNPLAHRAVAGHYAAYGDAELAARHFARAAELEPHNSGYLVPYGQSLLLRESYDEAIVVLQRALKADANNAEGHFLLGAALANTNQLTGAQQHLLHFVQTWNANPAAVANRFRLLEAYDLLGDVALRRGNASAAVEHLSHSLALEPKAASAHRLMGIALGRLGRWRDAQNHLIESLAADPDNVHSQSYFAYSLARQGQKELAADHYAQLIRQRPEWTEKIREYTMALLTRAESLDVRSALELATQACEATAFADARLLDALAAAQAASGDFAGAKKTAGNALSIATGPLQREIEEHLRRFERNQALPVQEK